MVGHIDGAKKLEALRSVKVQDHDRSLYSIQVGSSESLTIIMINLGMRDVFEHVSMWLFESCYELANCFGSMIIVELLTFVRS